MMQTHEPFQRMLEMELATIPPEGIGGVSAQAIAETRIVIHLRQYNRLLKAYESIHAEPKGYKNHQGLRETTPFRGWRDRRLARTGLIPI